MIGVRAKCVNSGETAEAYAKDHDMVARSGEQWPPRYKCGLFGTDGPSGHWGMCDAGVTTVPCEDKPRNN